MINVLTIIGYILLFILCLSLLIMVHEAGHLATAKLFNVYCLEYSIGFGPALFHKKRKNGETYFSIRAIPFGGYVSMYGEGVELPEGTQIDASRSLEGIKKWKRAIILVSGVTMNAILALVLFFISETCFPKNDYYVNTVRVESGSICETVLNNDDKFVVTQYDNVYVVDKNAVSYFSDNTTIDTTVAFQRAITSTNDLSWNSFIHFYKTSEISYVNNVLSYNPDQPNVEITADLNKLEKIEFILKIYNEESTPENIITHDALISLPVVEKEGKRVFEDFGVYLFHEERWQSFGESLKGTFVDFGTSSTAIVRGIGSLVTNPNAWKDASGLVGIGFETTSILKNFGLGTFLYVWGLISVNLAIVNLLPFPGLDGWQLLVTAIEGISRKKIPEKVKNIVSFVGIALLFILMIVIVFKDVFTYIF